MFGALLVAGIVHGLIIGLAALAAWPAGQALAQPEVKATLARQGSESAEMAPAEFGVFVRNHIAKYAKVIKDANVTVD